MMDAAPAVRRGGTARRAAGMENALKSQKLFSDEVDGPTHDGCSPGSEKGRNSQDNRWNEEYFKRVRDLSAMEWMGSPMIDAAPAANNPLQESDTFQR